MARSKAIHIASERCWRSAPAAVVGMKRPLCSGARQPHPHTTGKAGFTLIEMTVIIAISAILVALAAPSMRNLIESTGVANSVNSFVGSISYARSEALKRGLPVTMCRSVNADTSSTPTCSSGSGWEAGWIVFVDFNGNGTVNATGGDVVLRAQGSVARSGTILQNGSGNPSLRFAATGLLKSGASSFSFSPPSDTSSLQRLVCVAFGGRARLITDTVSEACE